MLSGFRLVWETMGSIIGALPSDVLSAVSFVFCSIGLVGIFRSF